MATKNELIERGDKLADQYEIEQLKNALRNAIAINDNEERLALQWALKKKTNTTDGYKFTKEQESKLNTKLAV